MLVYATTVWLDRDAPRWTTKTGVDRQSETRPCSDQDVDAGKERRVQSHSHFGRHPFRSSLTLNSASFTLSVIAR